MDQSSLLDVFHDFISGSLVFLKLRMRTKVDGEQILRGR